MPRLYEALADLLEYPEGGWSERFEANVEAVRRCRDDAAAECGKFAQQALGATLESLQEQYTRTFDLNPVCTLEIGYHLFGENYKRGIFLARLRETESPYALGQEHQLPDYLPVVLRLLEHLQDRELRSALVTDCLLPAIAKMFEHLNKAGNPYEHLVKAIAVALESDASPEAKAFRNTQSATFNPQSAIGGLHVR